MRVCEGAPAPTQHLLSCTNCEVQVYPPPLCKHGRGPKSPGKTAVQHPPHAETSPCLHVAYMTAKHGT